MRVKKINSVNSNPVWYLFGECLITFIQDVLKLLTSQAAPLMLCYEGLQAADSPSLNILSDLGIHRLTPDQVVRVIQSRIDVDLSVI